ncbi:acyl-CoA--sterol O-acyltransferase 1-like [Cornus florida]|uniref:acyl-CoA--sterol O-acyltransferase 1-like n=1 Tax=Cornus florida TaxID=4283 RepID=UPI00289E96D4|nr:acyl-CoA--sterol O-acyltransferase 1-like [Cornus florida]
MKQKEKKRGVLSFYGFCRPDYGLRSLSQLFLCIKGDYIYEFQTLHIKKVGGEREREMEGEINNFIKAWLSVFTSLCYCYGIGKIVPKGTLRLLTIVPVVCLFLALPLTLRSMHLGGTSAFFIAWLANFKLLMFAFGKGPLSDPSISLPQFAAIASLPIKIVQNPSPKTSKKGQKSALNYATKILLLVLFVRVYDYSEYIHPKVILVMYCFHIYFALEIMFAMVAALARTLLGFELEPQFDEPYLSSSLQDFWGRRWNMMVSRILRPTVYEPTLGFSTQLLGRKWAPLPAIFSTFLVSGLMHELIFYYLGRKRPTWDITRLFLLHGLCLMAEIAVKKVVTDKYRLPRIISGSLTVAFVFSTGFWLFFPELFRCNAFERAFDEYAAVGAFMKDVGRALTFKS